MTIARQRDDGGVRVPREPPWDHSAAASCRRWLRRTLQALNLPADAVADAELVGTELVANAFVHAGPPRSVWLRLLPPDRLRITVLDGSTRLPRPRTARPTDTCGRGLQVVAGLADRWGSSSRIPGPEDRENQEDQQDREDREDRENREDQEASGDRPSTGKAVWAELGLPTRHGPVFPGMSTGTRHSSTGGHRRRREQ